MVVSHDEPEQITQNSKNMKRRKKKQKEELGSRLQIRQNMLVCVFFMEPSSKGQIKGHKISRIRQVSSES